ncbi:hypothetical protein C4D60_Mb07t17000 [Musa balbisiana]|uniref:CLAVATA3/ESR (CLE)-related protein 25 n=1 Tax=Musa balbisiana TaxID=52838 RepID=A0A4S8JID6_MUSBA|nr:hypothetical protein C4D60_Mb07t17000 [Musa balbisiana]
MCGSRFMRALITGLTFFLCLGLMLSVSMIGGGTKAPPPVTVPIAASSRDRQHMRDRSFDPFYASKRRVPKGPDPIHNRSMESVTCFLHLWCSYCTESNHGSMRVDFRRTGKLSRPPARA